MLRYTGKLLCFLALTFYSSITIAQSINGSVRDASTNQPIAGASVFVANSTYITICNEKGEFALTGFPKSKFQLAVTAVGYQTLQLQIDAQTLVKALSLKLTPITNELDEVVVSTSVKNGWDIYGADFIKNFIGTSSFAAQCEIKNRKDIKFYFDKTKNQLKVKANKPLVIKNNALGYEITY